jgi:hypothetical protein
MIHTANTVTYNLVNDVENFNKEMASDSLEWHFMQSLSKKNGVLFWPAGL